MARTHYYTLTGASLAKTRPPPDFGDQDIGSPGPLVTFVIENLGTADLTIDPEAGLVFIGPASTQYFVVGKFFY